ncbi:MAG: HAMP domain-containing sensor histidine kinase [Parvibaculum sp.]|uniref:sensor histidine kinase n=1 Tax=Parvibaculum sp. TaxID=2024848 RepID=UPI00271B4ABD|nr:HAMP domain-containing sensor histidine kinase [Parvibaculum sp.]MDO8838398.1 HAMP domain-containing sensor histidine kinase [Parvibaculum sp.]
MAVDDASRNSAPGANAGDGLFGSSSGRGPWASLHAYAAAMSGGGHELTPKARLAQLRTLAESQVSMPFAFPVLMIGYGISHAYIVAWPIIAIWGAAMVVLHLATMTTARRFLTTEVDPEDVARWRWRFEGLTAAFSFSFSSLLFLFWQPDDIFHQTYLVSSVTIALVPMTLVTIFYFPVFYWTILPAVGALALRMALYGDLFHFAIVGVLAAFTVLLVKLASQVNNAMQRAITLREDKNVLIDQLFKAKRDSDAARARAEEANRAKSHFLANMSHELRTPLNAIIGFSEVMSSEIFGKHVVPTYREYADDINRSGQHLLGLINDVLDLSRIEAGRFQITEEDVDIAQLAEDSRRILEIRAQGQRVTIATDFEPDLPIFHGDARAMRQTWINLLTNAIKFSPPGSEVRMFARMEANGEMRFGVHDRGPGIAESEIDKVLHAFTQGASGLAQPGKGSGLGLSIVKGLLAVHGGRFELKSKLGEGTQAECVLPHQRLQPSVSMAKRAS